MGGQGLSVILPEWMSRLLKEEEGKDKRLQEIQNTKHNELMLVMIKTIELTSKVEELQQEMITLLSTFENVVQQNHTNINNKDDKDENIPQNINNVGISSN